MLQQNLEVVRTLAAKDKKKAMGYLATKTREKFQNYMERVKPRTALPKHGAGPSSGNIGGGVTPAAKKDGEEEVLDFASQLRNMNNM
jgi:hypothetical protein